MSTPRDFKVYRFAKPVHWKTGTGARIRIRDDGTVLPEQPLAPSSVNFIPLTGGAEAPAFDVRGTAYWRTRTGMLQWLAKDATRPCEIEASQDIADSPRLAIGRTRLWAFRPGTPCLLRYDLETLCPDEPVSLPDVSASHEVIADITPDGHDGVWVLSKPVSESEHAVLRRIDPCGRICKTIDDLPICSESCDGIAYLAQAKRLAVLSRKSRSIILIDPGAPANAITVRLRYEIEGFDPAGIDNDRRDVIVLVGSMDQTNAPAIARLDSSGGLLDWITPGPRAGKAIRGATAWDSTVLAATENGVCWFEAKPTGEGRGADGVFFSPALYSPDTNSLRGWLRGELSAVLPKGATLTVSVLSTDVPEVMESVRAISKDTTLPPAIRQGKIREKLQAGNTRAFVFTSPQDEASYAQSRSFQLSPSTYAVPLFECTERWLWLEVSLKAAPDGQLPELRELRVIYPEISLAQYVPAIFRGNMMSRAPESAASSTFFRQLLGVLETTTQGIDQTIAALGRHIHPATAEGDWRDFVAGWLDLPWDDALPAEIKHRILGSAAQLLAQRGTRAGLERLLFLLFPAGRTRVIDVNVDFGLAVLGGATLPAVLSGLPDDAAVLSRRAVLGHLRLATEASDPVGAAPFMGILRIEIAEIAAGDWDRAALESLLPRLLSAMIPAGLRMAIRWRPDMGAGRKLDHDFVLDDPSPRHLGKDARLGLLVLAGGRHTRLVESGLSLGFRLE